MLRKSFTYNHRRYYVSAKTEKELKQKIKDKKKSLQPKTDITVDEWCNIYFDIYKRNISDNTLYNYHLRYDKYISPFIGRYKVNTIKAVDLQKILNNMSGFSSNYIRKIYNDLNQIFETAVGNELITINPMKAVIVPNGYRHTHSVVSPEDLYKLHNLITTDFSITGVFIGLMLYCGCRPEETSFITSEDIHKNILHIRGRKTVNADRYVPIPNIFLDLLPSVMDRKYIVHSVSGMYPVKKYHRTKLWNRVRKITGITNATPYDLRHTYCTMLQDAGVPITIAQQLMGHSTIKLTADVYTHKSLSSFNESTEKINAHFMHAFYFVNDSKSE